MADRPHDGASHDRPDAGTAERAGPAPASWYVGLTPGSAAVIAAALVATFVLANAFAAAHRTVGWVVACTVVALLVDPLVARVDRVLPRWLSVIVVLLGMIALIASVTIGLASDILDSLDELTTSAPEAARGLEDRYGWAAELNLGERVETFVDEIDARIRADAVSEAAGTAPTYLVTGILMLFLLAFGRRYFDGFVNQFSAPDRRRRVRTVVSGAATRGRTYLLAAIGHGILNGIVVGLVCRVLDLPAALTLGLAVGLFTILPLIGVLVGGLPALLLASGLEGWRAGLVVLVVLVVLQTVEAVVVRPRVDRRSVHVGPTIPIVVGLLGFELYGFGGAVYSIALAVIGLAALDVMGQLRGEPPVEGTPLPAVEVEPAG